MSQESTGYWMLFILPHLREQQMGIIVIRLVLPAPVVCGCVGM